eukprot:Skav218033  [mRNA]  locus=scaffold214:489880:504114:+ [translate_table: standard]
MGPTLIFFAQASSCFRLAQAETTLQHLHTTEGRRLKGMGQRWDPGSFTFEDIRGYSTPPTDKMGMKYVAAYLMAAGDPSWEDWQELRSMSILESVESEYDESIASKLVSELLGDAMALRNVAWLMVGTELEGKVVHEVVAAGKEKLKAVTGARGGHGLSPALAAAAAALWPWAAAVAVVVEEEEEEDMEFDLFG